MRDGKMCGKHAKEWQGWAGGPDGWGPWNPIPAGVTVRLADEQRAMILDWCREGRGCSDVSRSEPTRPEDLTPGDVLASDTSVFVVAVYRDPEGVWVEFSDGDEGYLSRPVRIVREA